MVGEKESRSKALVPPAEPRFRDQNEAAPSSDSNNIYGDQEEGDDDKYSDFNEEQTEAVKEPKAKPPLKSSGQDGESYTDEEFNEEEVDDEIGDAVEAQSEVAAYTDEPIHVKGNKVEGQEIPDVAVFS